MDLRRRLQHQYKCCAFELQEAQRRGDTYNEKRLKDKLELYRKKLDEII